MLETLTVTPARTPPDGSVARPATAPYVVPTIWFDAGVEGDSA